MGNTHHFMKEAERLEEGNSGRAHWRRWGPYLSERQWGTVREDYSPNGTAWDYLSHDQARSRAYRWGEDGIAGLSDDHQRLCLALALWNGKDPILKEPWCGGARGSNSMYRATRFAIRDGFQSGSRSVRAMYLVKG